MTPSRDGETSPARSDASTVRLIISLMKEAVVVVVAAGHVLSLAADVRPYLLIAVGLLAFTIQQNGYRAAGLAAFLPAFAVMEPVCGALLGLMIYHERLSGRPGQIAVELVACAAATWGIARLAGSGLASGAQPATPVSGNAEAACCCGGLPCRPGWRGSGTGWVCR